MPIYRYKCECGQEYDEFRKIDNRNDSPICLCGKKTELRIMPTSIKADIEPYMTAANDKRTGEPVYITSGKQHREFLRRNDYVELGNDRITPRKKDEGPADAPMMSVDEMKKQGYIEEAY